MKCEIGDTGLLVIPNNINPDLNECYSFKGRTIDMDKPVYVYRNLHKKRGVWYSIKQKGVVVAHAKSLMLTSCEFIVNEKGREKVVTTKSKFPHAYIKGWYKTSFDNMTVGDYDSLFASIVYDPYKNANFRVKSVSYSTEVDRVPFVICNGGIRTSVAFLAKI